MGGFVEWMDSIVCRLICELSRPPIKEACAEFLATFVLVLCGDGVLAACILGRMEGHSMLISAFGWGFALMIAVAIAGGVSGGHANPAVTLALATAKKCPWKNVLPYMLAQYLASFIAACIVHIIYLDAIFEYDGGLKRLPPEENSTAEIFATYPKSFASVGTCLGDQIIGTALLLLVICAATDLKNLRVPPHTQPMVIGLGLTAVCLSFGHNCGAPLNPARDLSPRIFSAVVGYGLKVFSYRNYTWFWIPILGPHLGAILGVWLYRFFVELPFQNYSRILDELESIEENRIIRQSPVNAKEPEPVNNTSPPELRRTSESLPHMYQPKFEEIGSKAKDLIKRPVVESS